MAPHVCVYRLWKFHSNTDPRILLPTDSVARVRKEDDMPGDGNSIDSEANPKSVQTDAREGARPLEKKNADADASQNCVDAGADKSIWIETPASCIPSRMLNRWLSPSSIDP